jgi:hypothetical protein
MKIVDLYELFEKSQFPKLGLQQHPDRGAVLAARSFITSAITNQEFLLDCIRAEVELIDTGTLRRGLTPFVTVPGLGIRLAFGYWPPGGTPGAHEHTAWTITGVCWNELEVLTFDRAESYRRREFVPKSRFSAAAGRVGYIYEPCIHQPKNLSHNWSLSLHVSSPRDGEPVPDGFGTLTEAGLLKPSFLALADDPHQHVINARQNQTCLQALAQFLSTMASPEVADLFARCYSLASTVTRRELRGRCAGLATAGAKEAPWSLVRVHDQLRISHRRDGDMVALDVETENGRQEALAISDIAGDALAFVAREQRFEVQALPGKLSDQEREFIAEALEQTGLFKRTALSRES